LDTIEIPDNVEYIGESAFIGCPAEKTMGAIYSGGKVDASASASCTESTPVFKFELDDI
jgi:hypothetical protein